MGQAPIARTVPPRSPTPSPAGGAAAVVALPTRHDLPEHPDAAIAALFRRQFGMVSRGQALRLGHGSARIERRLATGIWLRIHPGVYCLAGTRSSHFALCMAALLYAGPGAYLSHTSAGTLLGILDRADPGLIHLTVPHRSPVAPQPGLRIHRTRVPTEVRDPGNGLTVSCPVRTLIDLAAVTEPERLRATLHHAIFQKIVTLDDLRRAARGRSRLPGFLRLRREMWAFDEESDSGAEVEADRLFRRNGIVLERQYAVTLDGIIRARLDFAQPALRLAIEVDGAAHHADPAAQARDRQRDRLLTTLGWHVLRIAVGELRRQPAAIVEQVRAALAQRACLPQA